MSHIVVADEICLLASNPYDAGQRSLWHLDKVGMILDCSKSNSATLGPDLELIYAVPSNHSGNGLGHMFLPESQLIRISEQTHVKFVNAVSLVVFSIDLSPSMNVVDTSFKSLTTGCHLVENLVDSLSRALYCLASGPKVTPNPLLRVTVVVHGVPDLGVYPLLVGELVTEDTIPGLIGKVETGIARPINFLSHWLQANHVEEQRSGAVNCSRTRSACTSAVCQANDLSVVVRDCLTAISLTCAQLSLSKAMVNKSIIILTDGVFAHPRRLPYDNILMHLNFVDVAMHILQIGGGFAPWSALGYASDPDLLRTLAASTPTGLFVQDHHLELILDGPNAVGNVLWKAISFKCSSLANQRASHMPYKSLSYQSSLITGSGVGSYIEHIQASAVSRRLHAVILQGIDNRSDSEDFSPNDFTVSSIVGGSFPSSPLVRVDESENESIYTLQSYLQPERTKARPYLYKQYVLPGVSVAQLIHLRAREGFLKEAAMPRVSSGTLTRSGSFLELADSDDSTMSFAIHWGPVMDIVYEISEDEGVRIKLYLRMPSGDFFLKFKQQLAAPTETYFGQMCRQMDAFVESIFEVDDALARMATQPVGKCWTDVASWHRWFTVRTLFVLLDVSEEVLGKRIRHGMFSPLIGKARETLLSSLRLLATEELEKGKLFMCKVGEWPGIQSDAVNSHRANTAHATTDSAFFLLELSPESGYAVAKLSLGFFGMCPKMERSVVEGIGRKIRLLHTPSPILREMVSDVAPKLGKKKGPIGMGTGESFYTYNPEPNIVNRFMFHHGWEVACPPASVQSDILSLIHDTRLKEGWKCIHETATSGTNTVIYARLLERPTLETVAHLPNTTHISGLWVPTAKTACETTRSVTSTQARQVSVEWEKFPDSLAKPPVPAPPPVYIRGMCTCLHVQHTQVRGEKPILKCQVWADRAHSEWKSSKDENFRQFCHSLIILE